MATATQKVVEESVMAPYYDHNKHTCILVSRSETKVKFIPLDVSDGLKIHQMKISEFNGRFKPIVNYPAERAIEHFKRIAIYAGATPEAQESLGVTIITQQLQETEMPTTKKSVESVSPSKSKTKGPLKIARAMTAAQRFKELIMEGKLSDDKIFAKVQKEFDLDDSKKSYVKWYRNDLKKRGENPPEAK